jgi:hypothetical protein
MDKTPSGFVQMQRELKALEPGLVRAMQKEAKAIAKPGADKVKAMIPSVAPLTGKDGHSGMLNRGRLGWNVGVRANKVSVKYSTKRSRVSGTTSLVSIRVESAVASMMDIAGKGHSAGNRTAAGIVMISKLKEKGASNFAWPAVEQEIPSMAAEIRLILNKYADMVSRKLS